MFSFIGIKSLGSEEDSLEKTFSRNSFLGENNFGQNIVALRIARVNHHCQPNAAAIYDETARVAILFAQKDIHPGEEISICYYSHFYRPSTSEPITDNYLEEEFYSAKNKMLSTHGIICPTDCPCYDPAICTLIHEGRQILHAGVMDLAKENKTEEALAAGEKLLDIYRRLNVSWVYRSYTEFILFQTAIADSAMLPRANEYVRSAVELFRNICPYSERLTKKYEKLMEHPEMHSNYMLIDEMMMSDLIKKADRILII